MQTSYAVHGGARTAWLGRRSERPMPTPTPAAADRIIVDSSRPGSSVRVTLLAAPAAAAADFRSSRFDRRVPVASAAAMIHCLMQEVDPACWGRPYLARRLLIEATFGRREFRRIVDSCQRSSGGGRELVDLLDPADPVDALTAGVCETVAEAVGTPYSLLAVADLADDATIASVTAIAASRHALLTHGALKTADTFIAGSRRVALPSLTRALADAGHAAETAFAMMVRGYLAIDLSGPLERADVGRGRRALPSFARRTGN